MEPEEGIFRCPDNVVAGAVIVPASFKWPNRHPSEKVSLEHSYLTAPDFYVTTPGYALGCDVLLFTYFNRDPTH